MAMEIETTTLEVPTLLVSNLARNMESTNTISIYLHDLIQKGESEIVMHLGSSNIRLKPHDFTPRHLSELLLAQQVTYPRELGQYIAHRINNSLDNDNSLGEPVFVSVSVNFITVRRFVLLHTWSGGASFEVLKSLVKEQPVESMDLEEETESQCPICFDDLSKSHGNITRTPRCLHMFHQVFSSNGLLRKTRIPCVGKSRTSISTGPRAKASEATA